MTEVVESIEAIAHFLGVHEWKSSPGDVLRVWSHPRHGTYIDGLFKMHDQEGFPLSCSLDVCMQHGAKPCLRQFISEACASGWSREKAERTVQEAIVDSGAPKEWLVIAGLGS